MPIFTRTLRANIIYNHCINYYKNVSYTNNKTKTADYKSLCLLDASAEN